MTMFSALMARREFSLAVILCPGTVIFAAKIR